MRINEIRTVPATPEQIAQAKVFLLRKWQERAAERGDRRPTDLSNACKFVSMFAKRVFGGQIRGNWDHQYVVLSNGEVLDLTAPSRNLRNIRKTGRDPYEHDDAFWNNDDHHGSMESCKPRVEQWVKEFANLDRS